MIFSRSQVNTGIRLGLLALAVVSSFAPAAALAQRSMSSLQRDPAQEKLLREVRLDQKLNAPVPKEVTFKDETGKDVRLGDYLHKPVMLMLIQYRCTMLCTEQMNVLIDELKQLQFTPGKEFNLLIVSIDPREKPDLAAEVHTTMVERYGRPEAASGLHFLTGTEEAIKTLAGAVGFHYVYDAKTDQFAHPDGVMIVTPEGKVARYYFNLNYAARDLRYGLIEAAKNRIGNALDAIALLCFHYNPTTGKYGLVILSVVRLAGIATVLMMALGVIVMKRRDRVSSQAAQDTPLTVEG